MRPTAALQIVAVFASSREPGLLKKLTGTHRWVLTDSGRRVFSPGLKARDRRYPAKLVTSSAYTFALASSSFTFARSSTPW